MLKLGGSLMTATVYKTRKIHAQGASIPRDYGDMPFLFRTRVDSKVYHLVNPFNLLVPCHAGVVIFKGK